MIVVALLVAMGLVNYVKSMNNMRQKEAMNTIDSIFTAEKNYMYENTSGANSCAGVADCNAKLRLAIPLTTSCSYVANDASGTLCVQADCTSTFGKLSKRSSNGVFVSGLCP